MAHAHTHGQHRSIVLLQSAPSLCPLCGGERVMGLVRLLNFPAVGRILCPQCTPEPGHDALEIPDLPFRIEQPTRGGAA